MVGKVMLEYNFVPRRGLGIRNQCISQPFQLKENVCRYGLGYDFLHNDERDARERHQSMSFRRDDKAKRMNIPSLSMTFPGPPHVVQVENEQT